MGGESWRAEERAAAMRSIKIVIRYYDAKGTVIFEDIPNLGHQYRVPVHWVRWEIYWDEALVQSGARETRAARRTDAPPVGRGTRRRATQEAAERSSTSGSGGGDPPERDAQPWRAFAR